MCRKSFDMSLGYNITYLMVSQFHNANMQSPKEYPIGLGWDIECVMVVKNIPTT